MPRDIHSTWKAPKDRRDAVDTVLAAEKGRMPDLLPLRHGRMVRSPFTFYRGSALAMAADLASTPVPAPWEWDVKRLAASFVVACRDNGLKESVARDVTAACVRTYRESMTEFSQLPTLELWYRALGAEELIEGLDPNLRKRVMRRIEKERSKSRGEELFPKLVEQRGDVHVIKDHLPTMFLQVKEARASVLEPYAGKSVFPNRGQRVVDGYRRMPPASDMFLGWSGGRSATSSSAS